jgi:hypothetical protein
LDFRRVACVTMRVFCHRFRARFRAQGCNFLALLLCLT